MLLILLLICVHRQHRGSSASWYAFMFSFGCMLGVSIIKAGAAMVGKNQTMDINAEAKEKALQEEKEVDLGI